MTVTVPATVAKETYSFTIVKKGKTFNERINYSYSEYAKADGKQADVAAALAKVVNANTENTGVKCVVDTSLDSKFAIFISFYVLQFDFTSIAIL